jgi:hypothetical protein
MEAARAEQGARALLDASQELTESTDREIDRLVGAVRDADPKKAEAAREEVKQKKAQLRDDLSKAAAKLEEVERTHPTTIGRGLQVLAAPLDAAYAGETLPPPPAPSPPPPGAVMNDGESVGETPAMGGAAPGNAPGNGESPAMGEAPK